MFLDYVILNARRPPRTFIFALDNLASVWDLYLHKLMKNISDLRRIMRFNADKCLNGSREIRNFLIEWIDCWRNFFNLCKYVKTRIRFQFYMQFRLLLSILIWAMAGGGGGWGCSCSKILPLQPHSYIISQPPSSYIPPTWRTTKLEGIQGGHGSQLFMNAAIVLRSNLWPCVCVVTRRCGWPAGGFCLSSTDWFSFSPM